jgi:putative spermidine/putrescine transport system ATP-binding protein
MRNAAALPISIRQLSKSYGRARVLDDVALDIRSGEFLTLLGPSGSGKTTLLMMLAGFVRPDQGIIRFGDSDIVRLPPHKRDVGMVFQNYALFPHMDVGANVAFPLRLRDVSRAEAETRVERALELVRLGGYARRRVDQLSGGQRQRVALARAVVFEPRILLMDEPLSALDKQLREHMQIELRQLHERLGMTTVYVTHDQREALTMSDRIAVIDGGRIQQIDAPRAIYERPANRFVAEFVGESTFVPVVAQAGSCAIGPARLRLPDGTPDGATLLMVRPERLRPLAGPPAADEYTLEGNVAETVYQGDSVLLRVLLTGGAAVAVRLGGGARMPQPGDEIRLALRPGDFHLLPSDAA